MILVRDLCKDFEGGLVRALKGVNLRIERGEFVALMGPSGCGKSTLLHLLAALDEPTSGEIMIDRKLLRDYRPYYRFRAETIGFVFQLHHLIPTLTLRENVEMPMYALGLNRGERKKKAAHLLAAVGLEERKDFSPLKVSGGERQRVAIARALANDPKIILADEPTGSIDSESGKLVLDLFTDLCSTRGVTMLMATHNPDVADRADRIIRMRDGLFVDD